MGAAYLIYLGVRMLFTRRIAVDTRAGLPRSSPMWLVLQGVLSNVTNPKIVLFFFAFLPQFVDPASPHPTRDLVALGVLYAALALPVKGGVALVAARLSDRMLRRPVAMVWMNRACGALLVALGARLARG
jgi:threonine/homoserine/homoserine lactone efflux protein